MVSKFFSEWIEAIWKAFKPTKRKRLELRFVSYGEADELIRGGDWQLAPEEDKNHTLGMVWIERLEKYPQFTR